MHSHSWSNQPLLLLMLVLLVVVVVLLLLLLLLLLVVEVVLLVVDVNAVVKSLPLPTPPLAWAHRAVTTSAATSTSSQILAITVERALMMEAW
jgi:hypothetical protein